MDKSVLIQKQIKNNAEELQNYVRDLKLWEEEMKRKDRQLSNEPTEEALPPVRRAKLAPKSHIKKEEKKETKKRLTTYDYSSWDKFDVEKACEEIDNEDKCNNDSEEINEDTAAQDEKYLKEKALYEKELGNKHVKASKWNEAIECYTRAIKAFPRDPIFFANRALCYLKKKKFEMVESDCTESLKLDPTYVKAMLRRAAAREALDRMEDAQYDLRNALKLEPNNSQALKDLDRLKNTKHIKHSKPINSRETEAKDLSIQNISGNRESLKTALATSASKGSQMKGTSSPVKPIYEPQWQPCTNLIQPIDKPPHLRSKKSLKRIDIVDIGPNTSHTCARKALKSHATSPTVQTAAPVAGSSSQHSPVVSTSPTVQIPPPVVGSSSQHLPVVPTNPTAKPRNILTAASPVVDVPPPPSTSVQFHTSWNCIKATPHLRYSFLKQIRGESLPDIFKESLESGMFSSIVETLAAEFTARGDPVLSYLRGLTRVKRFSTLALFMSPSDKSNLIKLFDHCLSQQECSPEDIEALKRLYEIS